MTYDGAYSEGTGPIQDLDGKAHAAYRSAKSDLRAAIAVLQGGQLTQVQWAHVNYYFMLDPQNTVLPNGVVEKLQATLDGIKAHQLKVRVMFFNFAKPTNKELITIAKAQILNVNEAVRFFIHECTHIYASTDDHAERGYGNNQGTYRQPGLTTEEALKNADTYAYLTVQLAARPLV